MSDLIIQFTKHCKKRFSHFHGRLTIETNLSTYGGKINWRSGESIFLLASDADKDCCILTSVSSVLETFCSLVQAEHWYEDLPDTV
jgi:hypothetical protein